MAGFAKYSQPIDFVFNARVPLVLSESFDIVELGSNIFKNFDWENLSS